MREVMLSFELQSYWHAGTGEGGGPGVDARIALTHDGLPYLSGRAVRGLLREAMRTAMRAGRPGITEKQVAVWFGTDIPRERSKERERDAAAFQEEQRFATEPGALSVGSAVLGETEAERAAWRTWAEAHPDAVTLLRRTHASTRIAADGTAADQSLRELEIAVPMTLWATLEVPDDAVDPIKEVLPLIRALGANRTRGFGRVKVTLTHGGAQ